MQFKEFLEIMQGLQSYKLYGVFGFVPSLFLSLLGKMNVSVKMLVFARTWIVKKETDMVFAYYLD